MVERLKELMEKLYRIKLVDYACEDFLRESTSATTARKLDVSYDSILNGAARDLVLAKQTINSQLGSDTLKLIIKECSKLVNIQDPGTETDLKKSKDQKDEIIKAIFDISKTKGEVL